MSESGPDALRWEWAMPNSATFEIPPIADLVQREVRASDGFWIDPFSGGQGFADETNDLNPDVQSDFTLEATEFLSRYDSGEIDGGVLFDPPYSPRQIKEVYDSVGGETDMETTQAIFWSDCKEQIARICAPDATALTFGWNSGGVGITNGFEKREVLLVCHGGWHNDTICVVEDCVTDTNSQVELDEVTR